MRRALLAIVSGLSLALCLATVALWVLSQAGPADLPEPAPIWYTTGEHHNYFLWGQRRQFGFHVLPADYFDDSRYAFRGYRTTGFLLVGNGVVGKVYWNGRRSWHVFVAYWLTVAVTAVMPLRSAFHSARRAFVARRGRGRTQLGLCPACGYDLTGNVSGVCPECGNPIAERVASRR